MRPPPDTRVVIDEMDTGKWRIVIPGRPTRNRMFASLFLLCWLAGWAVGEVFAVRALFAREKDPSLDGSFAIWAAVWTAGGFGTMWLLRRIFDFSYGIESLLLDGERVKLIRALWGGAAIREFRTRNLDRFDVGGWWGLRMVVEGRSVAFGGALTPEERAWLAAELSGILDRLRRA